MDRLGLVGDADVCLGVVPAECGREVAARLRDGSRESSESLHGVALRGAPKIAQILDGQHPAPEAPEQAVELRSVSLLWCQVVGEPVCRGVCRFPRRIHASERVDVVPERLPLLGRRHDARELAFWARHPLCQHARTELPQLRGKPERALRDRTREPCVGLVEAWPLRHELLHLCRADARGRRLADERREGASIRAACLVQLEQRGRTD